MLGMTIVLCIFSFIAVWLGVSLKESSLVIVGFIVIGLLLLIKQRFRVVVDDSQISCRGLLCENSVRLVDVVEVKRVADCGWPADRFCGPDTYEIIGAQSKVRINFKYFPIECRNEVFSKLKDNTDQKNG